MQRSIIAGIPLGRAGDDRGRRARGRYLASEFDGFITGATLDINGGVYLDVGATAPGQLLARTRRDARERRRAAGPWPLRRA